MKSLPIIVCVVGVGLAGIAPAETPAPKPQPRGYNIPLIDLASQTERQVIVDKEPGQYLGHPTTVLLEDGKAGARGPSDCRRRRVGRRRWKCRRSIASWTPRAKNGSSYSPASTRSAWRCRRTTARRAAN
ncbi:MAG: hypothetical protein NTY01_25650 [Verrucomicrobia bacterium]|nr:hypothetical protein [Verrucomicrobiota bacterium]